MAILNRKVNTSPLVNEKKVKDIREDIQNNNVKIPKNPIIYQWWFKTSCFEKLFKLLSSEIKEEKILKRVFDGEEYGLLYVGKSTKGQNRLVNGHILDKSNNHSKDLKGHKGGYLSSLRQTLCGLLELPMSQSRQDINDFMDKNCFVSFWEVSLEELDNAEKKEIEKYYLPLNSKDNLRISTKHREILRESREKMRK